MKRTDRIPQNPTQVTNLTQMVLEGAIRLGPTLNLLQNNAANIRVDFHDYVGDPAAGPTAPLGKQQLLDAAIARVAAARLDWQDAIAEGRIFAGKAIDTLKLSLGRTRNANWIAAGFTRTNLRIGSDPTSMLVDLRAFLQANPALENAGIGVTAAQAEAVRLAIQQSRGALEAERAGQRAARQARKTSLQRLRSRLTAVREELKLLLGPDDDRWRVFGFRRPTEGHAPDPVEGLALSPRLAGEVFAEWTPAPLAVNYRVMRFVTGVDPEPVEVALAADPALLIRGLPTTSTVQITVTARNLTGESAPVTATIVLP